MGKAEKVENKGVGVEGGAAGKATGCAYALVDTSMSKPSRRHAQRAQSGRFEPRILSFLR